jgi:hypothetical protein
MKTLWYCLLFVLFPGTVFLAEAGSEAAALLRDSVTVSEVPVHRTLPHSFHDQAVESVRALYPDGEILAAERLGRADAIQYALVSYTRERDSGFVNVDCVATDSRRAYRLSLVAERDRYGEAIAAVMQVMSGLFPHAQTP